MRHSEARLKQWADPAYREMMLEARRRSEAYQTRGRKYRVLSDDQVRNIRAMSNEGTSFYEIAKATGLHQTIISQILEGKTYKDVL